MGSVIDRTRETLDGFDRQELDLNGIKTVVYSAGTGKPLVFLHGSGTFPGFAFARRWTDSHRVIIPYHPGFGESGDDDRIDSMQDYVLHYLDLFDALKLDRFHLVGFSFGGWMAAEFAIAHHHRLDKLVLVAPAGLVVKDPPATDLFTIPPAQLPGYLATNPAALAPFLPEGHDIEFLTLRYRETTAVARLIWERASGNPKLAQWLHRVRVPSLLLWGEQDRVRPIAHADHWLKLLPDARIERIPGTGHLLFEDTPSAAERVTAFLGRG
ncbi:alpha/beta fold hydrolase [Phreatobacter stygius]|uniref:Alpha/beta hydrolase n=1 Tax=Phreatobacter stygius TaxID=1940610 RepID=A0A4D7B4Y2_9HYPH|nr:alpha/beta hydrolase [Phreatobacter stygius]QCI68474.1 alpha/beta hydrolase [Phreatobacter stygius]